MSGSLFTPYWLAVNAHWRFRNANSFYSQQHGHHILSAKDTEIHRALKNMALINPTLEQVREIAGEKWACLECSECRKNTTAGMSFDWSGGEYPEAVLCLDCLKKMVNDIEQELFAKRQE